MICAPSAAASLTSLSAFAIFSFTFSVQRICTAATFTFRILYFLLWVSVLLFLCTVYIPVLNCSFIFKFFELLPRYTVYPCSIHVFWFYFLVLFFYLPCGICCVMQWIFPPPRRISLAGIGQIFLSGKTVPRISTAVLSCSSPNCGTTTPPFEI